MDESEFSALMTDIRAKFPNDKLPDNSVMWSKLDSNKDGQIAYVELAKFWVHNEDLDLHDLGKKAVWKYMFFIYFY